jgi:hypothetical protein
VLRQDKLVEVVCRAIRRGGVTSSKEPLLAALQPGPRIRLPRAEAPGDILYVVTNELQVGDVSVVHPGEAWYRWAAASQRDAKMRAQYPQDEWGCVRHGRSRPPLRSVIGISVLSYVCLLILVMVMWSCLLFALCAFCTCW